MRERARELELRGKTFRFFLPEGGCRSEVDRSNEQSIGCFWKSAAAATKACSELIDSPTFSLREERVRNHRLLEMDNGGGFGKVFSGCFTTGFGGENVAQRLPIPNACRTEQSLQREREEKFPEFCSCREMGDQNRIDCVQGKDIDTK